MKLDLQSLETALASSERLDPQGPRPECEVRVFGSRVEGTAKPHSDLDLAVVGPAPLGWRRLGRLKEACQGSTLSVRVDVMDWHRLGENFRRLIERRYEVIQTANS